MMFILIAYRMQSLHGKNMDFHPYNEETNIVPRDDGNGATSARESVAVVSGDFGVI